MVLRLSEANAVTLPINTTFSLLVVTVSVASSLAIRYCDVQMRRKIIPRDIKAMKKAEFAYYGAAVCVLFYLLLFFAVVSLRIFANVIVNSVVEFTAVAVVSAAEAVFLWRLLTVRPHKLGPKPTE